jgi:hypothetical protein
MEVTFNVPQEDHSELSILFSSLEGVSANLHENETEGVYASGINVNYTLLIPLGIFIAKADEATLLSIKRQVLKYISTNKKPVIIKNIANEKFLFQFPLNEKTNSLLDEIFNAFLIGGK